ncbi:MAG TPA: M28 family peptidase [Bryobacteraceae bacterium]|nr:M28 family peptidase [Bryobacteraceae bacterium]
MLRAIPAVVLTIAGPVGLQAQISNAEKNVLDSLDTSRVTAQIRFFSEDVIKTPSGAGNGTAVAGSAEERALADVIGQEMSKIGLSVRREPFAVRAYEYGPVSLTANKKPITSISLHAAGGTWGRRDGVPYARGNAAGGHQLRTTLVDAGEGYSADYDRAGDVKGKAVLVRRGQPWPVYQILEAAHRGAAAMLLYDYPQARDNGIRQDSMWYHEQVPMVAISKNDAADLQRQLQHGPVEVALENRVDSGDGQSQNVLGTITGIEFPDEWIIVSAHYDRWWQSAQDNCAGVAAMLEIARALKNGWRPRRSIMFLATGGEEAGIEWSEQDWLAGSHAFVSAHPEILRRLVYDFNIDLAGWTSKHGTLASTPDIVAHQQRTLADLGVSDRVTAKAGMGNTTDAWNFGIVGAGAASILQWNEPFGPQDNNQPNPFLQYYHTQLDIFHSQDYENLPLHLRIGALSVLRMDAPINVPLSFPAVAAWVETSIDADGKKVEGVSFEAARAALHDFEAQAERVEVRRSKITAPDQVRNVNRWLMRTRKDLMPWLFGQNASLRTTGYANTVAAVSAARIAAERGDRTATLSALERVNPIRMSSRVSPEAARQERLYWYTNGDWSPSYGQKQRLLGADLDDLYRRLAKGGDVRAGAATIAQFETEARANLKEALFVIGGKLDEAAAALREAPLP